MTKNALRTALLAALAVSLVLAPTALGGKGKGGGGGSGTIALVVLESADGLAHFGQQVTFEVSAPVDRPQVNAQCYQNGSRVYDEWHGFFEGAWFGQIFTLGPTPSWQGGDADCTARLVSYARNGRLNVHATMSFHTYP